MKTAELEGALLDYWVAKAEGKAHVTLNSSIGRCFISEFPIEGQNQYWLSDFMPSERWADGGPIIERIRINVGYWDAQDDQYWYALIGGVAPEKWPASVGSTPLIAAMRAYVASRFGEEVTDEVS